MARSIPGFGEQKRFSNKLLPFLLDRVPSIGAPELATVRFKDREKYEAEIQRLLALHLPSRSRQTRTDYQLELEQHGLLVESTSVDSSYHIQGVKFWGHYRPGARRHYTYSDAEFGVRFGELRGRLQRMNGRAQTESHQLVERDPVTSTDVKHVAMTATDVDLAGKTKRED